MVDREITKSHYIRSNPLSVLRADTTNEQLFFYQKAFSKVFKKSYHRIDFDVLGENDFEKHFSCC